MPFHRPEGLIAGYHSELPEPGLPQLFHFGEQWMPRSHMIGLHAHHVWELYLQLKGETIWEAEGKQYLVAPGGLLAMPPDMVHRLVKARDAKHHFYFCAVDIWGVLKSRSDMANFWRPNTIYTAPNASSLTPLFQALAREITLDLAFRTVGIAVALEYLLVETSRVIFSQKAAERLLPQHGAVFTTQSLMDSSPERKWSLRELAARSNISPAHLIELFRNEVGVPPKQYLLQARTNKAIELLQSSDLTITEIAFEVGFSSSQHMASSLKKRTGKTALEHRTK